LAAASALLSEHVASVIRRGDDDVRLSVGNAGTRWPDDGLALCVSPRRRDDDGVRLEVDASVQGGVQGVGRVSQQSLKKTVKINFKNFVNKVE
jgi:hypothetical protein